MKKISLFLLAVLSGFNYGASAQTFTFAFTGSPASWTVPSGVTSIGFQAQGAMGGLNSTEMSTLCSGTLPDRQGYGACVKGTLAVTPGQVLNIYVGGRGTDGTKPGCVAIPGVGGFNGGGNGAVGYGPYSGGGGGGESDIRSGGILITNAVVVAAGGGGAGGNYYFMTDYERGGDGGTLTGEDGYGDNMPFSNGGAQGGQPGSGGLPGSYPGWTTGLPGLQGAGGNAGSPSGGGGGGGGWWGGGGGCWGGGGGGASYTDPSVCTFVTQTRGCNSTTDGSVVLCLTDPGIISGMKPLCTGQTLTLTESKPGGIWSSSNTNIATVSPSGTVTGVNGGLVTISYTLATPCATVYAIASITVVNSPAPITGSSIVCVAGTPMFSDATPAGFWTSSNTAVVSIDPSTGIADGIYPGSATITYTIPFAGCSTTIPVSVVGIGGPHSVCTGSSVALILPVGGGGAWSSSNSSVATVDPSGNVTGVSIGTSTISYSSALCPESIVMTVNPIAPVIGADSVCVAGTAYYTDIVGIGSWSSSNSAVASVSPGPGLVTGISAGTATISFTTPAGCMAVDTVAVIALPPAITGTMHVCVNATTILSNSLAGGVWSSADPAIATVNFGGTVTGISPDTTSILYTILPNCSTSAIVIVNPLPLPITGIDTICPGVMDTFRDASRGGLWSSSTPVQDTIVDSTGILTSRLSGTGVISYTLPTGCTISKSINIYPVPTPLITYNKFDNTLYTDPTYVSYQWYDSVDAGPIPHATSPSLGGIYSEWYYVVITDINGCKSPSAKFHFNNAITGVKNTNGIAINIFPNPVTGMLYIESPVNVRAVINGIDGKIEVNQANAKVLDISKLASGVYMISLYDDSGAVLTIQKIIKE
jgi:uncharacterized protein YjdB